MRYRIVVWASLLFAGIFTAPAGAQFRRETKPTVEPQADPLQVAVLMSHSIDRSSSGDPAFVEFSPDSKVLYIAGPVGPIPRVPRPHSDTVAVTATGIASVAEGVEDGGTEAAALARRARLRPNASAGMAFRIEDLSFQARFIAQPPGVSLEEWLRSADLSPDGKYVAGIGGRNGCLYIYDAATGKTLCCLDKTQDRRTFQAERCAFVIVGDKLHVLTEQYRRLNLHRVPDGAIVDKIDLADDKFAYQSGLSATPDGKLFAVGTTVWDGSRAELLSHLPRTSSQVGQLTPSGREVLLPYVGDMLRWDRTDEKPRKAFSHVDKPRITALAVSPGDELVAVARGTDTARDQVSIDIFDYRSEGHLRRLTGHVSTIHALAFSPDGKLLASASRDGSTRLWNVAELK